jgi:hypothetical protein
MRTSTHVTLGLVLLKGAGAWGISGEVTTGGLQTVMIWILGVSDEFAYANHWTAAPAAPTSTGRCLRVGVCE